jgi:hypothetical protein
MPVVTLEDLKAQLNFTDDIGEEDDPLLEGKIAAAQGHIERLLGFRIADRFGGEDQEPVPPSLAEAVLQLAAWWYEQREAAGGGMQEVPFGVSELVAEFRGFTF